MADFKRKTDRIQSVGYPVIKQVYGNQGSMYERIMVPITDGKRVYNIPCDLKEAYETEGKSVVKQFEKTILLHIIDDCWKENLRSLDELKHSVQNASNEQKDDLTDPGQKAAASHDTRESAAPQRQMPIRKDKMPGRNDLCPCGSGKKFKNCHGKGIV